MKIKKILHYGVITGFFYAIFECEHCKHEIQDRGFDNYKYYCYTLPKVKCELCGKTSNLFENELSKYILKEKKKIAKYILKLRKEPEVKMYVSYHHGFLYDSLSDITTKEPQNPREYDFAVEVPKKKFKKWKKLKDKYEQRKIAGWKYEEEVTNEIPLYNCEKKHRKNGN